MNLRPEAVKLLGKNRGGKLLDISLGDNLQKQRQQRQNKQVGLHQTKKLLHSKGNHQQNEKATHRMGGNT